MQLPRQVHTLFHHPQGMERIRKHPFLFHQQAGEGSCFGLVLLVRIWVPLFWLPASAKSREVSSHRPLRSQHSAAHPSAAVKVSTWRCMWRAPPGVLSPQKHSETG